MIDKIQLLPDSVANQIAAGEVIQRPASVIKELVENSVDAGATRIDVLVVDAGKTSIQVVDNGVGMSPTDARLSFERHATSKIRKAEDLFSLHTMGFRGEALPSIAAVSQVTLKTRLAESQLGTCLNIAGSKVTAQEMVSCPQGTNFLIENLFFNVPVRRRFLKSNSTELNNIITAFQRIALVYPDIAFTLHSNNQELFNLPATNTLQRIVDIFGKKINQQLLPFEVETTLGKINGYVGKPESAHKKNILQYFFVNGRYMKHPYFQKAVQAAFERLVPQGDQVPFFIYFTMNPEDIDVNIHPTKTEIKFQDEQALWQILSSAVRQAVGKFNNVTAIDFDTEGQPDIPLFNGDAPIEATMPKISADPKYNPFNSAPTQKKSITDWQTLYDGIDIGKVVHQTPEEDTLFDSVESSLFTSQPKTESTPLEWSGTFQYKGSYIITSVPDGLMVIDQQRAHERILYTRYMAQMDTKKHASQKVLFPETIHFDITEMLILPAVLPEMQSMGFELTDEGGGNYAINAIPAGLEGINATRLISDMVASAKDSTSNARKELYSSLAASMAHSAAIPYGQVLSTEEMEQILRSLFECDNHNYTPSGKTIYTIIPHTNILQLLG